MVADIDAATDHVHLLFYIWLPDNNGRKIIDALIRAAGRGVTCRAMADDLGSRGLIRSEHWQAMRRAGVRVASGLPIGNPLLRPLPAASICATTARSSSSTARITYCGSQNCADPEFLVKARFAPWVDAVIRFEGPIARQNQILFASDWMAGVDEDIADLLHGPHDQAMSDGMPAQVIGTGPTVRSSAMREVFVALMFAARREVVITTPYYVPDESLQSALCTSAYRGVDTTLILPARNDSQDRQRGQPQLLRRPARRRRQGLRIFGRPAAHQVADRRWRDLTLIGSANMDRRSLDLNYENNILVHDAELTAAMRARQQDYIGRSRQVTMQDVAAWPMPRRLLNNAIATLGPLF